MLKITEKIKNQTYEISLKSTGIIVGEFIKVHGFYYYSENKNRSWGVVVRGVFKKFAIRIRNPK